MRRTHGACEQSRWSLTRVGRRHTREAKENGGSIREASSSVRRCSGSGDPQVERLTHPHACGNKACCLELFG